MIVKMKDFLRSELIGKNIKIISSTNTSLVGVEGKIVDETKHTFVLNAGKRKRVMKNTIVFQVNINNTTQQIDGKLLEKRTEERIKIK